MTDSMDGTTQYTGSSGDFETPKAAVTTVLVIGATGGWVPPPPPFQPPSTIEQIEQEPEGGSSPTPFITTIVTAQTGQ